MVGEELKKIGVSRLIGADITPAAHDATERDRPGIYDSYYLLDFSSLKDGERDELNAWSLDCLVCVAALGFGDILVSAFLEAFNMIAKEHWISFNIKETFLDRKDESGFSHLIRELIFSEYLDLYQLQRYHTGSRLRATPSTTSHLAGRRTRTSRRFL